MDFASLRSCLDNHRYTVALLQLIEQLCTRSRSTTTDMSQVSFPLVLSSEEGRIFHATAVQK